MLMCMSCGNTNRKKFVNLVHSNGIYLVCKAKAECMGVEEEPECTVREIDELLLDTIRVLRQVGFKTLHCCQGHHYGPDGNNGLFYGDEGYISFEIDQTNKEDFKKYETLIKYIPDNFDNFEMEYEIVKGPKGPDLLERNTIIEKLVIRFIFDPSIEILTHLDWLEQNIKMHKKLFMRILDLIEDLEDGTLEEDLPDYEKPIEFAVRKNKK